MTIDGRRRLESHDAAEQTWSPEVTVTLMEMLPPAGWGDVATRQQLTALEARIDHLTTLHRHRLPTYGQQLVPGADVRALAQDVERPSSVQSSSAA